MRRLRAGLLRTASSYHQPVPVPGPKLIVAWPSRTFPLEPDVELDAARDARDVRTPGQRDADAALDADEPRGRRGLFFESVPVPVCRGCPRRQSLAELDAERPLRCSLAELDAEPADDGECDALLLRATHLILIRDSKDY